MKSFRPELDPRSSFSAKIFLCLLLVSLLSTLLVAFISTHFFSNQVLEEIEFNSSQSIAKVESKFVQISSYLTQSSNDILKSAKIIEYIQNSNKEGLANYFSGSKYNNINVFDENLDLVMALTRDSEKLFVPNNRLEKLRPKLKSEIADKLSEVNILRQYFSNDKNLEFTDYIKVKKADSGFYFIESSLLIRADYFEAISSDLSIYLQVNFETKNLLNIPIELVNYFQPTEEPRSLLQFKGDWYSYKSAKVDGLEFIVLRNVDHLLGSLSRIYWRVFLIGLLIFLLTLPVYYFASMYLSEPVADLLNRIRQFRRNENQNLIAVSSRDEIGMIIQEINHLFGDQLQIQQSLEARTLEAVVSNKKNDQLRSDYMSVLQDYVVGRIYRRKIESIISEVNYSQSIANSTKKFCQKLSELVDYLQESSTHTQYLRKNEIPERLRDLHSSADLLSTQTYKVSDELISQLWFMDLDKNREDSDLDLQIQRAILLMSHIFPSMKVEFLGRDGLTPTEQQKKNLVKILVLVLFLVGKQSRDGNLVKIALRVENDKNFNSIHSLSFELENEISMSKDTFDQEGKNLLKNLDLLFNELGYHPIRTEQKAERLRLLRYQISSDFNV